MTTLIFWFRNDLRTDDNPALLAACARASRLLCVFIDQDAIERTTRWGFARVGPHRRQFLSSALGDLARRLDALGGRLTVLEGSPLGLLPALVRATGATGVVCEEIAAPEEIAEVDALRAAGLSVETVGSSLLLPIEALPFARDAVPDVFTAFRQAVERARVRVLPPRDTPAALPPPPSMADGTSPTRLPSRPARDASSGDAVAAWSRRPEASPTPRGGESAGLAHLEAYFSRPLAHAYKATRNALSGTDSSTRFSAWLANGSISPRRVHARLRTFEQAHGANEGTYWIWFELLWREHFRLLHLKHGSALYRRTGLRGGADRRPVPRGEAPADVNTPKALRYRAAVPNSEAFDRWCEGRTGESLVDAGMRELRATGWLSNRMRQIVASFLIHDLACDWRAGAAWFESMLVDYDVFSNQGNWLYIAGLGTDPRGGRRFDPVYQAGRYDADGSYRSRWGTV